MYYKCYLIPREERWVIARLASHISNRMLHSAINIDERRSLMRLLFGLQRLPRISAGLNVHITWRELDADLAVRLSSEGFFVERCHTYLQYFQGSHHLLDGYLNLSGDERRACLENWVGMFSGIEEEDTFLSIEDYSETGDVDTPPLNELWSNPVGTIYFDDYPSERGGGQ